MEIELPYFEGGPNWQLAGARLPEALHTARHAATPVTWPTAGDPDEAGRPGFRGSPILASGRYPFARPADRAGTACRLNSSDGAGDQSLTVRQIRAVLAYAG
ncbi:MAG TPA: hypothetical protein VF940_07210 [Streptosporangiaceae bacterium]